MGVYIARRNMAILRLSGRSLSFCGRRWVSCSCAQRQTHALLWTWGHFPNDCSLMNPRLELKEAQQRSRARRTRAWTAIKNPDREALYLRVLFRIYPSSTHHHVEKKDVEIRAATSLVCFFHVRLCLPGPKPQGPTFGNNPRSSPQNGPQERCQ